MIWFLHYLYWFLIFNIGTFYLLGLPTGFYKISIPAVGLLLLILTLIKKGAKTKFPFLFYFVIITGISILSKELNGMMWFSLFFFLVALLLPYLYFIVLINEKDLNLVNSITKWVVFLTLIQIPLILIKYILLGQSEKGAIGSLSVAAGSLSTIFPIFVVGFLISFYLFYKRKKYLFFILGYILFALIGNKRAITYLIPLEFVVCYLLFLFFFVKKVTFSQIRMFVVIILFGLFSFYIMVRANPSLNKEQVVWGSFDLEYLLNYSETYTSSEGKGKREMRRKDGLIYFVSYVSTQDIPHFLLGDGAGMLYQSVLDEKSGTIDELYGIRYGGRMGVIWLLLQVGFLGTIVYLLFLFRLIFSLIENNSIKNNHFLLGFITVSIFMMFDIIFYSNTFIALDIVKHLYFYSAALIFIQKRNSLSFNRKRLLLVNDTKIFGTNSTN